MLLKRLLTLTLLSLSFSASAQLRWFDIELIVFERKPEPSLKEDLSNASFDPINYRGTKDIIADAYREVAKFKSDECKGITPTLEDNNVIESDTSIEIAHENTYSPENPDELSTQISSESSEDEFDYDVNECNFNAFVSNERMLPLRPAALSHEHTDYIYLLSPEQLTFNETVSRLRRNGHTPLLHTAWRQPESNIRNATPIYLYGGQNLTANYQSVENQRSLDELIDELANFSDTAELEETNILNNGVIQPPENDELANALAAQTWQLEGVFKVFIRRNYLNIEADFNLNEIIELPVENDLSIDQSSAYLSTEMQKTLHTERFSQFRRVISSQIHYFDHPRVGIIMQIRRYNH